MTDEEMMNLKETIKSDLEPRLKEQFINGIMAGYASATMSLYAQIKDMTSAKQIKSFMKQKCNECEEQLNKEKSE